jgi:hypothetical protein
VVNQSLATPATTKDWKHRLVAVTVALIIVSFPIFLVTGCAALYWAWVRGNLNAALPFLPWARNFGMLGVVGAAIAFGILFSSKSFPLPPETRLRLSILATVTIAFFAEFRNEGKFFFKNLGHFFGRGTWIHDGLNRIVSSSGDFLYRMEFSHWNDFLIGPAIVSVLFALAFIKIHGAFRNRDTTNLSGTASDVSADLDHALRFARILMNVGLFWFFIQAWAEKAGYLSNPFSNDEIDLPVEFASTVLGFWMVRVLSKPFDERSEKFKSTLVIDFVCAGVIGLLYTIIVGPLTESIASAVGHGLNPAVANSLDFHEYTSLDRHMRPIELLLLAGVTWWGLNRFYKPEAMTLLNTRTR